ADRQPELALEGCHGAQVRLRVRRGVFGRAMQQADAVAQGGLSRLACERRLERLAFRAGVGGRGKAESENAERRGDFGERRHAGGKDDARLCPRGLEEQRRIGDLARADLEGRQRQLAREEAHARQVEGRREEGDTALPRARQQRAMIGLRQLELAHHLELAFRRPGARNLVLRLGRLAADHLAGAEGLELVHVGAGRGGGVDHRERALERAVMVHAGFGDDQHRAHASPARKKCFCRRSARGTLRRTSAMRFELSPPPYGFTTEEQSRVSALAIAAPIALRSGGQSMTDAARGRPFCRSPMLTAGLRRLGASTSPLEELPTTASTCDRALRYAAWPSEACATARSRPGPATNASIMRMSARPSLSAFGSVKIRPTSWSSACSAASSSVNCAAGVPASSVAG